MHDTFMALSSRTKTLRRFHERDDPSGLNADHVERIRRVLTALQDARSPRNLDLPGWRLHQLKGGRPRTMERARLWELENSSFASLMARR